jgi:hypothetical protein
LKERGTTFNKYLNGSGRNQTLKQLKEKNQRLKREYAPVRRMTAKQYEKEKSKCK